MALRDQNEGSRSVRVSNTDDFSDFKPGVLSEKVEVSRRDQQGNFPSHMVGCNSCTTLTYKLIQSTVASQDHILKKFSSHPPSLIVHLHPTHFRFDQQDGSFSYHSEMRLFLEHLQKKTIPHDMLEEFRGNGVRFYDGWLIVRVVDHKSVAATAGASSHTDSDDHVPFSIHNYNPYITPSSYVPYPTQEQPKPSSKAKSPIPKQEPDDGSSSQINGGSSSTINGEAPSGGTAEATSRASKKEAKWYHVALRPTLLSRNVDLTLDSMQADPRSLNRRQSQAISSARAPGSANMPAPATPLTAVPPTPTFEKGPPPKRQKTRIDPKDLLEYEAHVVNATAPPIFLDAVENFEEAQSLQKVLKDPHHDEEPPSPKGRKRTVAQLAADDALAKSQERFMLIMDERNPGGPAAANATAVDGQVGAVFQPRFERYNALENIKAQHEEKRQRDNEVKMHADAQRRAQQEHDEQRKREDMVRAAELHRRRQIQERQAAALAAQQHQNMPQINGVPPNMQRQMMHASQAQGASPVVRTSTPHVSSSPIVSQMKPNHGIPMAVSSSNQGGAGSPPRPGSAVQHGHPGVTMARGQSNQGPSRNGTPQVQHSTPGMPHATPVLRHGTPGQMSQASPHGSMMAQTPQMAQAMMNGGQMSNGMGQNPQMAQQLNAARQQQQQMMFQRQQQNLMRQNMPNGHQLTQEQQQQVHFTAQQHAQLAVQQQQQHQIQQGTQPPPGSQTPLHGTTENRRLYQAAMQQSVRDQMAQLNSQGMQQQGSPQPHPTPQQQHAVQMPYATLQQQQQQLVQNPGQNHQMPNGMSPQQSQQLAQQQQRQQQQQLHHSQMMQTNPQYNQQIQSRCSQLYQGYLAQLTQNAGGDLGRIPQGQLLAAKKTAMQNAIKQVQEMMHQRQQARQQQQQQQMGGGGAPPNAAMIQQMQAQQQAQQQAQAHAQQQQQHMAQYQQQLQQMQQQGHAQGQMMQGMPGTGVMPK